MSRSYRAPWVKDNPSRGMKRIASRAVRAYKDLADGMAYKKVFDSYDLCDFCWQAEKPMKGEKPRNWFEQSYEEKLREYRKATRK